MNKNLKDFMSKNSPKYPLKKYSNEIMTLLENGYTQIDILKYLQEYYDISTSRQTLSKEISYLRKTATRVQKTTTNESVKKPSGNATNKNRKEDFLKKMSGK